MQKQNSTALAWEMMMVASLFFSLKTGAQVKNFDLKADYEHFWIDHAAALKKIYAENNNERAALMVNQMKLEVLPRFKQLAVATSAWKKNESAATLQQMETWTNGNAHALEVAGLQSDLMMRAAGANGALSKSFTAFMREMTAPRKMPSKFNKPF